MRADRVGNEIIPPQKRRPSKAMYVCSRLGIERNRSISLILQTRLPAKIMSIVPEGRVRKRGTLIRPLASFVFLIFLVSRFVAEPRYAAELDRCFKVVTMHLFSGSIDNRFGMDLISKPAFSKCLLSLSRPVLLFTLLSPRNGDCS